jgi:archaellum component FlaF (FlaF/FlaG flagellin family)
MLAGWDNIQPLPDGTITIYSTTWRSTMPAGYSSAGSYGYAITADRLEEFVVNADSSLMITAQPQSITVPERGTATFTVDVAGNGANYHWSRNGTPIPGVNLPSYTINSAAYPGDNGATFQVIVSNSLSTIPSSTATLTVTPDSAPPVPVRAVAAANQTNITITFNEPVDASSVLPDSFYIDPPGSVTANTATLTNGTNVIITVTSNPLMPGQNYSVVVNGIRDASSGLNPMPVPVSIPIRRTVQMVGFDTDNVWKYSTETNLFGTGWETTGYNDTGATWLSGPAGLGHESDTTIGFPGNNAVPIRTHMSYPSNSAPRFFRTHFTLPVPTNGVTVSLRDVVEDGAVYYINGQEVFRHNVNPGPLSVTTRAPSGQTEMTPIQGPFDIPLTNLVVGDNVIAAVVIQNGATSSDIELAVELSAEIPQYVALTTMVATFNAGTGEVTLTWTGSGTLQQATVLLDGGLTSWSPVAGNPPSPYTFTPPASGSRFYRVR